MKKKPMMQFKKPVEVKLESNSWTYLSRGFYDEKTDTSYEHYIDTKTDSVHVIDHDLEEVLVFDAHSVARTPDGEIVGKFYMDGGYEQGHWAFEFAETFADGKVHGLACRLPEGLLDTEVLVTKEFLRIKAP